MNDSDITARPDRDNAPKTHADRAIGSGPPARRLDTRLWVRWVAGFVGFPLAGLAARAAAGPIDTTPAAVIGGLAAGVVLGAIQALARLRSTSTRTESGSWIAATAIGLGVGLGVGASLVDFATDAAGLVAMGLVSGAGVGVAQAIVLTGSPSRRTVWAMATSGLWGLGWLITSQVISDTDSQYATFGASGALVFTTVGGLLLATTEDRRSAR